MAFEIQTLKLVNSPHLMGGNKGCTTLIYFVGNWLSRMLMRLYVSVPLSFLDVTREQVCKGYQIKSLPKQLRATRFGRRRLGVIISADLRSVPLFFVVQRASFERRSSSRCRNSFRQFVACVIRNKNQPLNQRLECAFRQGKTSLENSGYKSFNYKRERVEVFFSPIFFALSLDIFELCGVDKTLK